MSNNSEYTKEYIDRVDGHFHSLERVLLIPARDKTLTFQQVEELFSRFGEMDSMKEYLVRNVTSAEEIQEELDKLEERLSDKEKEIDDVKDDLENVIGELESLDEDSFSEEAIKDIVKELESIKDTLDKLGRP